MKTLIKALLLLISFTAFAETEGLEDLNTWSNRERLSLIEQLPDYSVTNAWQVVPWRLSGGDSAISTHTTGIYKYQSDIDSTFLIEFIVTCKYFCGAGDQVHTVSWKMTFWTSSEVEKVESITLGGGVTDDAKMELGHQRTRTEVRSDLWEESMACQERVNGKRKTKEEYEACKSTKTGRYTVEISGATWGFVEQIDNADLLLIAARINGREDPVVFTFTLLDEEAHWKSYSSQVLEMTNGISKAGLKNFLQR
jgi:hypothetical protein